MWARIERYSVELIVVCCLLSEQVQDALGPSRAWYNSPPGRTSQCSPALQMIHIALLSLPALSSVLTCGILLQTCRFWLSSEDPAALPREELLACQGTTNCLCRLETALPLVGRALADPAHMTECCCLGHGPGQPRDKRVCMSWRPEQGAEGTRCNCWHHSQKHQWASMLSWLLLRRVHEKNT